MSQTTLKERLHSGFVPGVILIGLFSAVFRLWGVRQVSLRFEETLALAVASNLSMILKQIHPPFYFLLLAAWTRIFGDSIYSLQILFALFGTAGVVLTALIGRKILGVRAGLFTAAVLCVAPYPLMLNRLDGMHSLTAAFASAAILLLIHLLEEENKPFLSWSLAVINILGLFTNYLFIFVFLTEPLFVIFLKGSEPFRRKNILLSWLIPLGALLLASPLLYAQYIIMMQQNASFPALSTLWKAPFGPWISDATFGIPWSLAPVDIGPSAYVDIFGVGLSAAGGILLLFGVFSAVWHKTTEKMAVLALAFTPVFIMSAVSTAVPVWSSSSFSIFFPFFAIVWGMALDRMGKAGTPAAAVLVVLTAWGVFLNINVASKVTGAWMKPPAWKDLTADLVMQYNAGDNLLIAPDWMAESLHYHAAQVSGGHRGKKIDRWPVIGVPFNFFLPEEDLLNKLTIEPQTRAWLIAVDGFSVENAMRFLERAGYRLTQHAIFWRLNLDLFQKVPVEELPSAESDELETDGTTALK